MFYLAIIADIAEKHLKNVDFKKMTDEQILDFYKKIESKIEKDIDKSFKESNVKMLGEYKKRYNQLKDVAEEYKDKIDDCIIRNNMTPKDIRAAFDGDHKSIKFPNELKSIMVLQDNLDPNFGVYDSSKEEAQTLGKEVIKKAIKKSIMAGILEKKYFEQQLQRGIQRFFGATFYNMEDGIRKFSILSKTNKINPKTNKPDDMEIDPVTNKTYRDLKKEIYLNTMNQVMYCKQYFSVYRTDKEIMNFSKTFFNQNMLAAELQGGNAESIAKSLGINEDLEVKKMANIIKENGNELVAKSTYCTIVKQSVEECYKYASPQDLALLTYVFTDMNTNQTKEKFNINLDKILDCNENSKHYNSTKSIGGEYAQFAFPKQMKYLAGYKAKPDYGYFNVMGIAVINNLLKDMNVDINNIQIVNKKDNKPIIKDENYENIYAKTKQDNFISYCLDQANKGESLVIKDENGKFLLNLVTDINSLGVIHKGKNAVTFEFVPITVMGKNYGHAHSLSKKDTRKFVNKKVDEDILINLTALKNNLSKLHNSPNKDKDSYAYEAVEDILDEIIHNDFKDKEKLLAGLTSVRSFAQAYLNDTVGIKNEKDLLDRQDVMNSVYMSLINIEKEFDCQKTFMKELDYDLTKEDEIRDYLGEVNSYLKENKSNDDAYLSVQEILTEMSTNKEYNKEDIKNDLKYLTSFMNHFIDETSKDENQLDAYNKMSYALKQIRNLDEALNEPEKDKVIAFDKEDPTNKKEDQKEELSKKIEDKKINQELENNNEICTSRKGK